MWIVGALGDGFFSGEVWITGSSPSPRKWIVGALDGFFSGEVWITGSLPSPRKWIVGALDGFFSGEVWITGSPLEAAQTAAARPNKPLKRTATILDKDPCGTPE